MRLIRDNDKIRSDTNGCVLAIGNFDGLHRGHQALIKALVNKARQLAVPAAVMTFEPLPREFFSQQKLPLRLTSLGEKITILRQYGVDKLFLVRFDQSFAQLSKEAFVERYLKKRLKVKGLILGEDFRFGFKQQGDIDYLRQMFPQALSILPVVAQNNQRVSSTDLRLSLQRGDFNHVKTLLGRHYSISGRVIHGKKLGRKLGFPTANIRLFHRQPPLEGIFAVNVSGVGKQRLNGIAYISRQATLRDKYYLLEVFILDFDQDIYGCRLQVDFRHKLRGDDSFDNLDALKQQMEIDNQAARRFFAGASL
ncbi:MAG: bifunctional riboflavin kinase/FAD synthetase [Pseudomonadota bacterium]